MQCSYRNTHTGSYACSIGSAYCVAHTGTFCCANDCSHTSAHHRS